MVKLKEITDYLENYESLWQEIDELGPSLPCMDLGCIVDEDDYYGCDFSGNKQVYMLFFTGQSNYFPAICNIYNTNKIDSCPVYIFDIASDNPPKYIGNFRTYIQKLLTEFITKTRSKEATKALQELSKFSTHVIDKEYDPAIFPQH